MEKLFAVERFGVIGSPVVTRVKWRPGREKFLVKLEGVFSGRLPSFGLFIGRSEATR